MSQMLDNHAEVLRAQLALLGPPVSREAPAKAIKRRTMQARLDEVEEQIAERDRAIRSPYRDDR